MELFFDLVYVFAFTQLSAHLYGDLSWQGGAETAVIFVALWWSWSYTSWATGWIDPERLPVVALLSVLMIASLVMASAIPDAFTSRGETFAVAYVAMQLLRSAFMVWAFGLRDTMGRNYAQLLAWSAISGVVWIVGGAGPRPGRAAGDLGGGRGRRPRRAAARLPPAGSRCDADVRLDDRRRAPRRALPAAADDRVWRVVPEDRRELRARSRHGRGRQRVRRRFPARVGALEHLLPAPRRAWGPRDRAGWGGAATARPLRLPVRPRGDGRRRDRGRGGDP